MRAQRQSIARNVAERLFAAEAALDIAAARIAELNAALPLARLDARLSTAIGQDAFASSASALVLVAETRERIVATHANLKQASDDMGLTGRTKVDNIEIDDDAAPRKSHKSLATIVDADGTEHDILRDNMPFGSPGRSEYGTYFIGYSRHLWVVERMLQRMFVGEPAGAYDRLLDFSTAHTGTTFFAPSRATMAKLAQEPS